MTFKKKHFSRMMSLKQSFLDSATGQMMELDKSIQEKTEKFEKEKHMFLGQSKQLRVELEQVKGERDQLHGLQKDQESELTELRQNKELLSQWEKQIADIIQWVTEEKDARWVWFFLGV